jgi:hypothetical protein
MRVNGYAIYRDFMLVYRDDQGVNNYEFRAVVGFDFVVFCLISRRSGKEDLAVDALPFTGTPLRHNEHQKLELS